MEIRLFDRDGFARDNAAHQAIDGEFFETSHEIDAIISGCAVGSSGKDHSFLFTKSS